MFMRRILISACLLGVPVRYDGRSVPVADPGIARWQKEGRLVPFCPETAGGLPVPRPPAEIRGGTGTDVLDRRASVVTRESDVTGAFVRGAEAALALCREQGITLALLKEKSPSCGTRYIYDGTFTKTLISGRGITAALLGNHEISVFSETEISGMFHLID